jgi:uncharacterized glyoxalase superfamily protein PhnB
MGSPLVEPRADDAAPRIRPSGPDVGVDALCDEYRAAGMLPSDARPRDTPWGTREFHLRDPDGNGLQFYRDR